MLEQVTLLISLSFGLTTLLTLYLFYLALSKSVDSGTANHSIKVTGFLIVWLILQALLSVAGVYYGNMNSIPPRIAIFGIIPTFIVILYFLTTKKGRNILHGLPLKQLTYLHIVRIPVELVLYGLFVQQTIPELMTFTGRNFDILAGLTAPFIAFFAFTKKQISHVILLVWNGISLALLVNIIVLALLSAPSPFQQLGFKQPNIAILYFPFSWLPTFVVPVVIFSHVVAIFQVLSRPTDEGDQKPV